MRLGKLRELFKGEKDGQKTIGESTREERRKPQAQNPELRKMEREARNQLEKARSEANQAVDQFKHGLKDSSLKEFALLKQRMGEREEEKKGWLSKEQEKVHTETLQLESKLKHEVDMKVVKMSTEGATRAERENHSQRLDMLKHQASERRETLLLSIKVRHSVSHSVSPRHRRPRPPPTLGGRHPATQLPLDSHTQPPHSRS